jgi:hypothetical protein
MCWGDADAGENHALTGRWRLLCAILAEGITTTGCVYSLVSLYLLGRSFLEQMFDGGSK